MLENDRPYRGRKDNQKMKPYLVMQYLMRETDDNHVKSAREIVNYLLSLGIAAEERSIYRDIDAINKCLWLLENEDDGLFIEDAVEAIDADTDGNEKIIIYDKHKKGFRVIRRKYEPSDIRLMAECIYASRYISQKDAERLVGILKRDFISNHEADAIRSEAIVTTRVRTLNKSVIYNLTIINEAMSKKLEGKPHTPEKVSFQYLKYDIHNLEKQTTRRKGATYTVSPYKLIINDGNYYLLAFDDATQKVRIYRVDRMKNVQKTGIERSGEEAFHNLDVKTFAQRTFSMYSGRKERVELRFTMHLLDTVYERFGKQNTAYHHLDDHHFSVFSDVEISQQFFGWLCGFGSEVQIIAPASVREEFIAYLEKIKKRYK